MALLRSAQQPGVEQPRDLSEQVVWDRVRVDEASADDPLMLLGTRSRHARGALRAQVRVSRRQPLQADPAKRGVGLMARPRERTLSSFLRVKPE